MLFADALPELRDALVDTFGDTGAVYRSASGERVGVTAIITEQQDEAVAANALLKVADLPFSPKRGDVIEQGDKTYQVVEVDSDEIFWSLQLRLRGIAQ